MRSQQAAVCFCPAQDNKLPYSIKSQENPQQAVTLLNPSANCLKPVVSPCAKGMAFWQLPQLRKHRLCLWQPRCTSAARGQAEYSRGNKMQCELVSGESPRSSPLPAPRSSVSSVGYAVRPLQSEVMRISLEVRKALASSQTSSSVSALSQVLSCKHTSKTC